MSGGHLCKAEAPTEAAAETEGEKGFKMHKGFTFFSHGPRELILQKPYMYSQLILSLNLSLSLIIAINSLLVGLPRSFCIV